MALHKMVQKVASKEREKIFFIMVMEELLK